MLTVHETGISEVRACDVRPGDKLDMPGKPKVLSTHRAQNGHIVLAATVELGNGRTRTIVHAYDATDILGVTP
jgi:hypothetical protein